MSGAKKILASLLMAVSFLWQSPLAKGVQQAENDDPFDAGGYNGAPEDNLVTRPIDEFFPPIKWEMDFQVDFDVNFGFGIDTETNTDLSSTFEPQYTEEEQFQKQSEQNPVPRSNLQVASMVVQPGAEIAAVAQPEGFVTTDGRELFFAWAFDGVSANGTVAGADPQDPPSASAPDAEHSRPAQTDADRDGIDDDWEVRYGLDPTNPGDAGQDFDGDGYTNDVYTNQAGEILKVTPPTSVGEDFGGSNLEEFIFGTDPNVADTDGDGFLDGQDVAGLGQLELTFTVPFEAQPGDTFELRLTTLGNSYQQFDRETNLVKVDSQAVQIRVGDSEQVEATLTASNPNPIPGERITLTAALGQTEFHPGLLTYSWFVNGQFISGASGESLSTFEYEVPIASQPNDTIAIAVRALNFTTGQEASASLELRVAEVVQLHYDPTQVVPGQPYTINATLLTGAVDPANLVYKWSKDGAPVTDQSGLGKTTFTETATGSPGEDFDLSLRVTTPDDSKTFGEVSAVVEVQRPEVDIITTDSFIQPGQFAELTAIPAHFKSDQLEFRWTIDGQAQNLPLDTRTIDVEGTVVSAVITVDVDVRTTGSSPDSAQATEFITVVTPPSTALSTVGPLDPRAAIGVAAQVVRAHPLAAGFGTLGATVTAALAIVAIKRRRYAADH